jgi:hypothetical protein
MIAISLPLILLGYVEFPDSVEHACGLAVCRFYLCTLDLLVWGLGVDRCFPVFPRICASGTVLPLLETLVIPSLGLEKPC